MTIAYYLNCDKGRKDNIKLNPEIHTLEHIDQLQPYRREYNNQERPLLLFNCPMKRIPKLLTQVLHYKGPVIIDNIQDSMYELILTCDVNEPENDDDFTKIVLSTLYILFGKHYIIKMSPEKSFVKLVPKQKRMVTEREKEFLQKEIAYLVIVKGYDNLKDIYHYLSNHKLYFYDYTTFMHHFKNTYNTISSIHQKIQSAQLESEDEILPYIETRLMEEEVWQDLYTKYFNKLNQYYQVLLNSYTLSTPILKQSSPSSSNSSVIKVDLDTDEEPMDYIPYGRQGNPMFQQIRQKPVQKRVRFQDEQNIAGLENVMGISCFIDSVLYPLLYIPIEYFMYNILNKTTQSIPDKHKLELTSIEKYNNLFLKIQEEVRILQNNVKNNNISQCSMLIRYFSDINDAYKKFMADAIQKRGGDDAEFLDMFMEFFDLKPTTVMVTDYIETQANSGQYDKQDNRFEYVSIYYPLEGLQNIDTPIITPLPRSKDGKNRYSQYTILDTECLIIKVDNAQQDLIRVLNINNKQFSIKVITLFNNGHYTSIFTKNNIWYKYDDLTPSIEEINLISYKQQILDNVSILIYTKDKETS